MTLRKVWIYFALLAVIVAIAYYLNLLRGTTPQPKILPYRSSQLEAPSGSYYTMYDEYGTPILQTGFAINSGDEFIDHDNRHYRIDSVDKWNAYAKLEDEKQAVNKVPLISGWMTGIAKAQGSKLVSIYHTHSDESFIPTQGVSSQPGHGAVYRVGEAMGIALSNAGINVDHNFTTHDPHDANAYARSRRTVFQLLKRRPDAIFDIHRDSAPSNAYFTYITGVESAKMMIVLGQQNVNFQTNLQFAKKIKAQADKAYPDLIRGIFIGHGNYNQDLYPRALLFEIGTDQLPEQLASDAASCLADIIALVLK
ncbi:MAG: stage II sporulation protein P [Chitinophagales bacterium]